MELSNNKVIELRKGKWGVFENVNERTYQKKSEMVCH